MADEEKDAAEEIAKRKQVEEADLRTVEGAFAGFRDKVVEILAGKSEFVELETRRE